MSKTKGYTIVELLIGVTIVAMLLSFGLSAFSKSRERQVVYAAKETILSNLQTLQKDAYTGNANCAGGIKQIRVSTNINTNTLSVLPDCMNGVGTPYNITVDGVIFTSSAAVAFLPLQEGISGTSTNFDYTISGKTYRVTVAKPGTITYVGLLP